MFRYLVSLARCLRTVSLVALLLCLFGNGCAVCPAAEDAGKTPAPAPTAPFVTLPATKTAKASRYFFLKATTNCPSVKWIVPAGLEQLDPEIPLKDANAIGLIGDAGTYTVSCYAALGDVATDIATCTVTVGTPAPPAPVDAFTQVAQTAYTADADANKSSEVSLLSALYTNAATSTVNDSTLHTLADVYAVMQKASASLLTATALPKTRAAVATYLKVQLGTAPTTALTPALRTTLAAAFTTVGAALSSVK